MSDHISKAFEEMDLTLQDSMLRRQALIAALEGVVKSCNLDFEKDTARTVEVKLAAMKTLDDLYKGQENVSMAKVKLALSRIDTKTNQNVSAVVRFGYRDVDRKRIISDFRTAFLNHDVSRHP